MKKNGGEQLSPENISSILEELDNQRE